MNLLLVALLLQSFSMPPRMVVEDPSTITVIPKQARKDYDKLWNRFRTGKEDSKVVKDGEKLLKKHKDLEPVVTILAYVDLYGRRWPAAEEKFRRVLAKDPNHRIALGYMAELAVARQDYEGAAALYTRLLAVDSTRTDLETKRQRALLLATDQLLRAAATSERENNIADAEAKYRQALRLAPREPILHARLAQILVSQENWDEAIIHLRQQIELEGPNEEANRSLAEALMNLGRTEEARTVLDRLREAGASDERLETRVRELEDLGRWGEDINQFREIESTERLTREQLAAVIVRYFPQLTEFRQTPQIVTDLQDSWARLEIQTIVGTGLMDAFPNHTFQPSRPVSRGELALVMARLTRLLGLNATQGPSIPLSDVPRSNPLFSDVQLVLGYGMVMLDDAGNFDVSALASGKMAVSSAGQLLQLLRDKTG